MAGFDLESLAIKEIIAEIEKRKQRELPCRLPPERQVRPNKRFLGRTIVSVLQHNRRQSREKKQNSFKKLDELNKQRHTSRPRNLEPVNVRNNSPKHHDQDDYERQLRLEMCFLGRINHLTTDIEEVPKKEKKLKFLTIDLTKKKKKSAKDKKKKKEKKKQKIRKKKLKSKKRRRRKDSTSSSSSSSSCSSSSSSGTNSISLLEDSLSVEHSSVLKIDLT